VSIRLRLPSTVLIRLPQELLQLASWPRILAGGCTQEGGVVRGLACRFDCGLVRRLGRGCGS